MGFHVLKQNKQEAILSTDGKTPMIRIIQPSHVVPKSERTTGLYHFALLLPSRADLSRFLQHLLTNKHRFGAADHIVSEAIYIDDPDGNGIEIYSDRPSKDWEWLHNGVAMATEPLHVDDLLQLTNIRWNGIPKGTIIGHIHLHVKE